MAQQIKADSRVFQILCHPNGGVYSLQIQIFATNEFTPEGDQPRQLDNSTGLRR
jgi:hypothetical protein